MSYKIDYIVDEDLSTFIKISSGNGLIRIISKSDFKLIYSFKTDKNLKI